MPRLPRLNWTATYFAVLLQNILLQAMPRLECARVLSAHRCPCPEQNKQTGRLLLWAREGYLAACVRKIAEREREREREEESLHIHEIERQRN
jgi:hypothetical protein